MLRNRKTRDEVEFEALSTGVGGKERRKAEAKFSLKAMFASLVVFLVCLFAAYHLYHIEIHLPKPAGVDWPPYYLVHNALIRTMEYNTVIESFVVKDGKIVDVGSFFQVTKRHPKAAKIDLGNNFILPGLIDSHVHLLQQGKLMLQADLTGSKSIAEMMKRLRDYHKQNPHPKSGWILGLGWDQNNFGGTFPTKEILDAEFPNTPVYLRRIDVHAGLFNSAALRLVPRFPDEDPLGGTIMRNKKGEPSGVLIDNAMWLIENHIPEYDEETQIQALELAIRECHKYGLTSVHDAGLTRAEIQVYKKAIDQGRFKIRDYAMVACDQGVYFCPDVSPIIEDYGGRLTIRSVKMYLDGALGSWGAAMLWAYNDNPSVSGLLRMPEEAYETAVSQWVHAGYQVNTHAIGDRANRIVVSAYEKIINEVGRDKDLRLRIEHAQIIHPDDLRKIPLLKIIPSFQPTHATSDMTYALQRLGKERIKGAYAWRTLAKLGARMPLGSDFPVEKVNPFLGIYAATTRMDLEGKPTGGWYPEETLPIDRALKGFTSEGAHASFQEHKVGTLKIGYAADFIVIDRDVWTVDPREIPHTQVLTTVLDGKVVYGQRFSFA